MRGFIPKNLHRYSRLSMQWVRHDIAKSSG
nr:MAG TPA: hypothetical protein [Caudoviricetes sp.]